MKKINVYLTDQQYDQLKLLQARLDMPMAELLRRALDGLLAQHATLPGLEAIQSMSLPQLTQFVQGLARRYEELAP
jgi:hypothetical protein